MRTLVHNASNRGGANFGWLKANYSFSFGQWQDNNRMNFGALRVLNDDFLSPKAGFPNHSHDNMEIITIPFEGAIKHTDNNGHQEIITNTEVQVMSAGTGIVHSESNPSMSETTNLIQLWIFPDEQSHEPRYGQKDFGTPTINQWQLLVAPDRDDTLWIHQDAYISKLVLEEGESITYDLNTEGNGVYVFVVEGAVQIGEDVLDNRDTIGIIEADVVFFEAQEETYLIAIEVPMVW